MSLLTVGHPISTEAYCPVVMPHSCAPCFIQFPHPAPARLTPFWLGTKSQCVADMSAPRPQTVLFRWPGPRATLPTAHPSLHWPSGPYPAHGMRMLTGLTSGNCFRCAQGAWSMRHSFTPCTLARCPETQCFSKIAPSSNQWAGVQGAWSMCHTATCSSQPALASRPSTSMLQSNPTANSEWWSQLHGGGQDIIAHTFMMT